MLHSVIESVKNHPKYNEKIVSKIRKDMGSPIDSYPFGLDSFDEIEKNTILSKDSSFHCLVPVKKLYSDDIYNRIDALNLSKVLDNISKSKGFSYNHASTLVGFLRSDGKIVLTQGNHRCAMAFLTMGEDALVVVSIRVHSTDDLEEQIKRESLDFHTDCSHRWNITPNQRFKSGYYAGVEKYVKLHDLGKKYNIAVGCVADGFVPKITFSSDAYLTKAIDFDKTPNKKYVNECLDLMSKYLQEPDIKGFSFYGLVAFRQCFDHRLHLIIKANPLFCSFDDFVKWIFTERKSWDGLGPLTTQEDITKESGTTKSEIFYAGKFAYLFNQYAKVRGLKVKAYKLQGNLAIPDSCEDWISFCNLVPDAQKKNLSLESMK